MEFWGFFPKATAWGFPSAEPGIREEKLEITPFSGRRHEVRGMPTQASTIELTPLGRKVVRANLTKGIVLPVNFSYVISGVNQKADGGYEAKDIHLAVAGSIGGAELKDHPELFHFY